MLGVVALTARGVGCAAREKARWSNLESDGIRPLAVYMERIAAEADGDRRWEMARTLGERVLGARDGREFTRVVLSEVYGVGAGSSPASEPAGRGGDTTGPRPGQ
jgi:hypothetical protein